VPQSRQPRRSFPQAGWVRRIVPKRLVATKTADLLEAAAGPIMAFVEGMDEFSPPAVA